MVLRCSVLILHIYTNLSVELFLLREFSGRGQQLLAVIKKVTFFSMLLKIPKSIMREFFHQTVG